MDTLMLILPFVALLGFLMALAAAAVAFFWPQVEWWLLCWLQRRRRARELRYTHQPRLAIRRPR